MVNFKLRTKINKGSNLEMCSCSLYFMNYMISLYEIRYGQIQSFLYPMCIENVLFQRVAACYSYSKGVAKDNWQLLDNL